MEVRELKTLLALMQDFGLVELEIEDKKGKVRLVKAGANVAPAPSPVRELPAALPAKPARQPVRPENRDGSGHASPPELGEHQRMLQSPMVGTFYRAPSPTDDPFVDEGDQVRKGQALCIIEAMKMMNEIESEAAGRVVKILCDNGQPVEYGQPLMILEAV